MKNFKRVIVAVLALLAVAAPASAQFRWGVKAGININKLTVSDTEWKENFSDENRAGFTGGLTTEFTIPIIGLGFDASLMYTHRVNNFNPTGTEAKNFSTDYISLPINLKYKIGLPIVGNFLTPYVFTGPEFALLCSKKAIQDGFKNKSFDTNWNVGIGLQFVKKVQVAASYGFGLNRNLQKLVPVVGDVNGTEKDLGRNKIWTVTVAYLF